MESPKQGSVTILNSKVKVHLIDNSWKRADGGEREVHAYIWTISCKKCWELPCLVSEDVTPPWLTKAESETLGP